MKILMVKSSNCRDVRLQKYKHVLSEEHSIDFIGWNRDKFEDEIFIEKFDNVNYILKGWSSSKIGLLFGNFLWLFLSIKYILKNYHVYDVIYCADFEAALPVWLSKKFVKNLKYIYDIYDEVYLRYNYNKIIKSRLQHVDNFLKTESFLNIQVDEIRLNKSDDLSKSLIIENSPLDFFENCYIEKKEWEKKFVVSGYLRETRGLEEIYKFACSKKDYEFIVVGRFNDEKLKSKFLKLDNVKYYDFMPQLQLFELIRNSFAIFSLYDPSIEINLKAASNKLYDALMLGIPVIVNQEIYASDFVNSNSIGVSVPYTYDSKEWDDKIIDIEKNFEHYSTSGRKLFEKKYDFKKKVRNAFSFK